MDENSRKKKIEMKIVLVCFVRRGGRKINCGVRMFSFRTYQKVFSSKWKEN